MFNHLKIGPRLTLAFGALLLLMCSVAGMGTWQTARLNSSVLDLRDHWLPSVQRLGELRYAINSVRRSTLNHLLEADVLAKKAQRTSHDELVQKQMPAALAAYQDLVRSPEEGRLLDAIKALLADYLADDKKLLVMSDAGATELQAARDFSNGAAAASFAKLLAAIADEVKLNELGAAQAGHTSADTYRSVLLLNTVMVVVALLLGSGLALVCTRSITRPIAQATQLADTVAAGDLSATIQVHGQDETAQLLRALGKMSANLARIVGQVRGSSDCIATGSAQIATGNADLSQRTEEQASNLQQTAASMEELAGTVRTSAATAQHANSLASDASAAAQRGGEAVDTVVTTMQAISAASRKIADIIGTIDGIAFQTNILALNAAVEAARAGEQGRGFAVVASEVRSLAGRAADAAKEIKTLIGASVERVDLGTRQVQDAGSAMADIVRQVQQVSQLINEISHATTEQSTGIGQVGEAVTQLDRVTQQNAALVEQSASAADNLKHQAGQLADAVRVFKLAADGGPAAAAPTWA